MAQDDTTTQQDDVTNNLPAPAAGEAPRQLGPIRLVRQIGKGGMGEVWLGRHEFLDRDVAVKVLSAAVMDPGDPAFREFIRGAKVAASLGHPGLNKVFHADVADGMPYLVLELLDGPNLREFVKQSGRLDLATIRAVIEAVGEAVAELHERDLVHRDLKPSNFVLTADGRIVVTDFGLACARPMSALRGISGGVAGTPAYMAPEMFDGVVSARTDVYAIGMTAYELLCGRPAFDGTLDELREQHKSVPVDVEPLRGAGVPEGVIEVVVRAASKDILFRPKSARRVLEAFRAAFDEAGIKPATHATLARMLKELSPPSADRAATDGSPAANSVSTSGHAANMAQTLSEFAAKKRDLRDSSRLRAQIPLVPSPPVNLPHIDPASAPLGVQPLGYSQPLRQGRPGLVTAIGVMSIIVACLSLLASLGTGLESVGLLIISHGAAKSASTPSGSRAATVPTSTAATGAGTIRVVAGGPTTTPVAPAALTSAEVQSIISIVQASLGAKKLNPAQVATLQTALQAPSQQLISPGTAWSPVKSTFMRSDGRATIRLTGGFIQIDATGKVLSQAATFAGMTGMPHFSPVACIIGAFEGVASLALAVLLLVAGIATLRHSQGSLRLLQICGWAKLPLAILGGIAYAWLMGQLLTGVLNDTRYRMLIFAFYALFAVALGCAYPIGLLIALRSGTVRGYYHSVTQSG